MHSNQTFLSPDLSSYLSNIYLPDNTLITVYANKQTTNYY